MRSYPVFKTAHMDQANKTTIHLIFLLAFRLTYPEVAITCREE